MNVYYTETDWEKDPHADVFVKKIHTKSREKYEGTIVITGFEIHGLYKNKKNQLLNALKDLISQKENIKDIKLIEENHGQTD